MKNKTFTFKNGKSITLVLFSSALECGVFIFIAAATSLMIVGILMKYSGSDIENRIKLFISKEVSNQIVIVDIKDVVSSFLDSKKSEKLSSTEIDSLALDFAEKLERTIENKASSEGLIIIPRQAVVAGGRDITLELKEELFKELS